MTTKQQPIDIYEEFYDERMPCEDDDSVIFIKDGDKVACGSMQKLAVNVSLQGKSVPGKKKKASRSEAEDNLHDAILEAVDSARKKKAIKCDSRATKCESGLCYTTYEIDNRQVKCRKAKRKNKIIWLCTYKGRVNSYCICVV